MSKTVGGLPGECQVAEASIIFRSYLISRGTIYVIPCAKQNLKTVTLQVKCKVLVMYLLMCQC